MKLTLRGFVNLFADEKIDSDFPKKVPERTYPDDEINSKYLKGETRIVTEQARYPLSTIPVLLESGKYDLRPDYQRRHRWDNKKRSKLIESIIMNVPIPPIFLYEKKFSQYEVMDGLQRLTTIQKFYKDEFKLEGLELWPEINGKVYSNLPEQIRNGIDRRYLSSIILLQETAKNEEEAKHLKQLVFERINSGGVKLSDQESRNSLFSGKLNELCLELSELTSFQIIMNINEPVVLEDEESDEPLNEVKNELYSSMKDVEYVLRFFAHRQRRDLDKKDILKHYLDFFLSIGNKFPEHVLASYKKLFTETSNLVYELFDEKAFWLWRKRRNRWNFYTRPTAALYDPLMYVVSQFVDQSDKLISQKEIIRTEIKDFYELHYTSFEGRNTNIGQIEIRTKLLNDFFKKYV